LAGNASNGPQISILSNRLSNRKCVNRNLLTERVCVPRHLASLSTSIYRFAVLRRRPLRAAFFLLRHLNVKKGERLLSINGTEFAAPWNRSRNSRRLRRGVGENLVSKRGNPARRVFIMPFEKILHSIQNWPNNATSSGPEAFRPSSSTSEHQASETGSEARQHLIERSFADASNLHGFKCGRWRGLSKQSVQDLLIAAVQNLRKLIVAMHNASENSCLALIDVLFPSCRLSPPF
jgi:Transposase DDE domain